MRRIVSLLMVGVFFSVIAEAQVAGMQPGPQARAARAESKGPKGEKKLRWICKRLGLNVKQWEQAESLIAVYHAELDEAKANAAELMQRVQDKFAEVQAAKAEGNEELATRLQEELRNMAPLVQAENNFFEALTPMLLPEQRKRLPGLRERVATAGDVSLRPIHVLRAALPLSLTKEQRAQLEDVLADFRDALMNRKPDNEESSSDRVERLIVNIRGILTPEQAAKYDEAIEGLRNGAPAPKMFMPPGAKSKRLPETSNRLEVEGQSIELKPAQRKPLEPNKPKTE